MKEKVTYEILFKKLKKYMSKNELLLIEEYYKEAEDIYQGMTRLTGEDYIYHSIYVAYLLAEIKMDVTTIGSALIHEAIKLEKRTFEEIQEKFNSETAIILESIISAFGKSKILSLLQ